MLKENSTYYVKVIILLMSVLTLINISLNHINFSKEVIITNENNYETIDIYPKTLKLFSEINFDFDLKEVSIYEDENYHIDDFLLDSNSIVTNNIGYRYKDERMSSYHTPGKYEISIIFRDCYGNETEKKTQLIIKEKPIEKKESAKVVKTTKKTTTKQSVESKIANDQKKIGTYGRLYFSSMYSIALYHPITSAEAQEMVDAKDSGAYYNYGNILIIADHAYQGFSIIKKQSVGSYVYIKNYDENDNVNIEKYVVRENTTGKNKKTKLVTDDGRDIGTDLNNTLALYTCNSSDGVDITIVLLDRVN